MRTSVSNAHSELPLEAVPSFLHGKQLVFFGGKGGVGKTSAAGAATVFLHAYYPAKKILLVSLDPAHSLADSLDQPCGSQPTMLDVNLWAQELSATELYREFIHENKKYFLTLATRGTYFEEEDLGSFFELSIPGIDEVMGVLYLTKLIQDQTYDCIVVDTAPTGHMLRFLSLPYVMEAWIRVFNLMQEKHHYLQSRFSKQISLDDADLFLHNTLEKLKFFEAVLQDSTKTEFVPVTISEPMALLETDKLLQKLREEHIHVQHILMNKTLSEGGCPYCLSRAKTQEHFLGPYRNKWSMYQLHPLPLFSSEVRGLEALRGFSQNFIFQKQAGTTPLEVVGEESSMRFPDRVVNHLKFVKNGTELIIFCGKGGVGKTTMAAASSLFLAQHYTNKKILIFSTDPAHSLSDSFSQDIGNHGHAVGNFTNLYGHEMNSEELLAEFKRTYRKEIETLFSDLLGENVDLKFDREVIEGLIDLCPPGVDELMAIHYVLSLEKKGAYDLFVLDSAPTGHLLRLLETPDVVRGWLKAIFELLLKYKGLIHLGGLAEKLIQLSKDLRYVKTLLTDPQKTKVVVVTIPEAMGVYETQDLLASLRNLKMNLSQIIINNVVPTQDCQWCEGRYRENRLYIKQIRKMSPWSCSVSEIPQFPTSIQGESLRQFSQKIFF